MKVLMINVVCGIKSTGRICTDIATALNKQGHEVKIAYGREKVPERFQELSYRVGSDFDVKMHGMLARFMDKSGFGSKKATKRLIKWIEEYNPDVIHLHNLHGYYINVKVLFAYLKESKKKIIWTLHDCWPFTGHCSYFDYSGCDKWKDGCRSCPLKHEYPKSVLWDKSKKNYEKKKGIFSLLDDVTIVTPSSWLADLVKESFLKEYEVKVIHNGIDVNVFKPITTETKVIGTAKDKKIVLGVAAVWNKRKGFDDFLELSKMLDETYQIVLVGLSDNQIKSLPSNIVGKKRTNDVYELAALYSKAVVFVNPTYEDNYPTTNLEAIACGTPVITYKTGGSVESAQIYGEVVEKGNVETLCQSVVKFANSKKCVNVEVNKLSLNVMIDKYLQLYADGKGGKHEKED